MDSGGIVLSGSGDVRAYTLAAATGSAMQLNSATGVILPGMEMAPDITTTSLAFMNTVGDSEAARAKFVSGPMAMRVMVSGGFESRIERISKWAGAEEGVKRSVCGARSMWAREVAVEERTVSAGGASKRWDQRSGWLV